jgi:hypothetical protein
VRVIKPAAFMVSLLALVVGLIGHMVYAPRFASWTGRPPSDLRASAGYRSAWRGTDAALLRRGDRVLEVVFPDPTPFAAHHAEPLRQAAVMAQRAEVAVVVTLGGVLESRPHDADVQFLATGRALVDEVLMNRSGWPIVAGSTLPLAGGSSRTAVSQRNGTQIVQRSVYMRVPRDGGRYLVFLSRTRDGLAAGGFGYGTAFEIRGSRLVAMSVPDGGTWQQSADTARTLTLVRALGAQPVVASAAWIPPGGLAP